MPTDPIQQELRAASKSRRATNRIRSAHVLRRLGIPFISNNEGVHLICTALTGEIFDFWPGTGAFVSRKDATKRGRGVMKLARLLKERP